MTTSLHKNPMRGVSTLLAIDRRSKKPIYRQIYEVYRDRILRKDLRPDEPVPSTRHLARELGVSRLPVLDAYAQLHAEGYFETRIGSGTFVSSSLPTEKASLGIRLLPTANHGRRRISTRAMAMPPYMEATWTRPIPFQVGQPALAEFPMHVWSRLTSRLARNMKISGLQYGDPMGLAELREAIARYLRTSRGVQCEAQQVMIVSGSQQGLDLTSRVLLDPGAAAWVEDPGYWLVHHVLRGAGCQAVPVPVDHEGLNVSAGIKLRRQARAAFVAPSHQYPLGPTMTVARRLQLLEWAQREGTWIVEDDYDSEYRYDSMPVPSLQGLDRNSRVIYIGTLSKVLFPSLRLGYLVLPSDLLERFATCRQAADLGPSGQNQQVLAAFIREGHFSRHIRRMRAIYAERRRVLVDAIEKEFGDSCVVMGAEAGLHVTIVMEKKVKDRQIAEKAARQKSLVLSALSLSYVGDQPRSGFVLGFGNSAVEQIPRAVRTLRELVEAD
jgi:GntR family transcriptional regulator/MocR family aminotransferase